MRLRLARIWCSGAIRKSFEPKAVADRAKRAWAAANEREREAAEQEGRDPDFLRPITFHECRWPDPLKSVRGR